MINDSFKPGLHKLLFHIDHLQKIKNGEVCGPIHISVWPTNKCQLNCKYCCFKKVQRNDTELNIIEFKKAIDILIKYGLKAVEMSLRGDETIYIDNNGTFEVLTIEELVSNYKNYHNVYSWSLMDKKVKGLITDVYEHNCTDPLIKITLSNGKSITTTKNHSIFFFENNQIISKETGLASVGDFVVVSKSELDIVQKENYLMNLSKFDNRRGSRPESLVIEKNICRLLGYFTAEGSYNYCRGIVHGVNFCFNSYKKEFKYIDDVVSIFEKHFNYTPQIYKENNKTTIIVSKKWIGEVFKEINCGEGSKKMRVPNIIFNLTDNCKVEYLKGLFGGDGNFRDTITKRKGIEYNRNSLHLKTSSKYLCRTLSLLLDIMKIENTIVSGINKKRFIENRMLNESPYYTINIQGFFYQLILFL